MIPRTNIIFIVYTLVVLGFLAFFASSNPLFILDAVFALIAAGVFYALLRRFPLASGFVVLGLTPFIMNMAGLAFSFYAFHINGFGYDKMIHVFNSFVGTALLYKWIVPKRNVGILFMGLIILSVVGIGSLNEMIEFIGQRYFGLNGPTMFSQGDLLSSGISNDFVTFDTWWDMLMNLVGALIAGLMILITKSSAQTTSKAALVANIKGDNRRVSNRRVNAGRVNNGRTTKRRS